MQPSPHVRVIFADLNLLGGRLGDDHTGMYDNIGSLIAENIKPAGPYYIVLWTSHPAHAEKLETHLDKNLVGCVRPSTIIPLPKEDHINMEDGKVPNPPALVKAIKTIVAKEPQVAALLAWEAHVMNAASRTVAEIGRLAAVAPPGTESPQGLPRLLASLAVASVGEGNVEGNRFGAITRALAPVLSDRVATSAAQDAEISDAGDPWDAAFSEEDMKAGLVPEVAAALNGSSLLATDHVGTGEDRGVVVRLSDVFVNKTFSCLFGMDESDAARQQFACKDYGKPEDRSYEWMLVQAQPACDHAQGRPGPLPFYLGLELPAGRAKGWRESPNACWMSPTFLLKNNNDEIRVLHVNARFGVFVNKGAVRSKQPVYRLRQQLLDHLVAHIHAYGARPGMISFRQEGDR